MLVCACLCFTKQEGLKSGVIMNFNPTLRKCIHSFLMIQLPMGGITFVIHERNTIAKFMFLSFSNPIKIKVVDNRDNNIEDCIE